jgi:predicted nucleic acid-binding protein
MRQRHAGRGRASRQQSVAVRTRIDRREIGRDAKGDPDVISCSPQAPDTQGSAEIGAGERTFMPSAKTNRFVDTNLLVHPVDPDKRAKRALAADLLERVMVSHAFVVSRQSRNECSRTVIDRRRVMSGEHARHFIGALSFFCPAPSGYAVRRQARRIQDAAKFGWRDCTPLSSARLACTKYFLKRGPAAPATAGRH